MNRPLIVAIFVIFAICCIYFGLSITNPILLVAALFGLYMAMNIGANDVANNVWPAVGAGAITLVGAVILAAFFESAGAIIAGGEVVKTIKKGIIDIDGFSDVNLYVYAMMSALLSAALWLNVATYLKAPVSTTHSIVGGILGAGIAALGFQVVDWGTMQKIVASWFISPVMGWVIAAFFLYSIKHLIVFKKDMVGAAKKWVPFFVALMSWAFGTYIVVKGIKKLYKFEFETAVLIGLGIAVLTFVLMKMRLSRSTKIKNNRDSVNGLFVIPLVFSAALLSFAHGANDVANAIWPLAAIYDAVVNGAISGEVDIPLWIMILGASGLSIGLLLYGPKIIKTVGTEITELDQMRAFCIALSAAITVIVASQLGLPVSSTHIALGWVFGVGFLREYLDRKHNKKKVQYVRRDILKKIISAWLITVPVVSFISACIFLIITKFSM